MIAKERKISKSFWALTLVLVMFLTNILGAGEVSAAGIEAPTITKAFIGDTSISGGNLHRDRVNNKTVRATVYVNVLDESNNVKAKGSVTPKSGSTWTVTLEDGKKLEEGDRVIAWQELNGTESPKTQPKDAEPSKAFENKDKLKMPTGEIWIEQTSSNIVNADEQAEAIKMLKDANTAIAGDIKSVEFSINGTDHAYYEVTYTDGSTSGKVEAPDLKIKQVTETSRGAKLNDITIVDNEIKGKLEGNGPFDGIKVQIVLKLSDTGKGTFCNENKCIVDKDSSKAVDATVDTTTGEFTYTIKPTDKIELGNVAGVSVKEPHKFKSCSQTTVIAPIPKKTEVKDPRKLTVDDKKAIDAAIRKAYTVNDESKLPNGTGFNEGAPAVIQIDDSGNVKIFSGNDVVVNNWDDDGKAIPEKNPDGSYKLKDGAKPTATIPAKDLLKNIKPDAPEIKVNEDDKTKINIKAQAVDTDANVITVSYTGSDDTTKTIKATKADDGTWSITEGQGLGTVDANGLVTLEVSKVKAGTTVTATVTDKGGIADDDKDPLTSDQAELKITKAILVEALGGLDPVDLKKWVGDTVDWKKGVKAKDSATDKDKIKEYLDGATVTDVSKPNTRNTENSGEFVGKIKVTFDDGSEIVLENQKLMVCDHVTSTTDPKLPDDAIEVELKLGEGTKVNNTDGTAIEGNKDNPTSYGKYKVKPGTDIKEYKLPTINSSVIDSIKLEKQDGYENPVWNNKDGKIADNFVVTSDNNVFTAVATTEAYKVTFDPNGGSGNMDGASVKPGGNYKLPQNAFTPPNDDQEFAGWLVDGSTKITAPDTEITITKDTVIKASWKPIEYKVIFDGNGGTGAMNPETFTKGSEYVIPEPAFKAPENKEFDGWKLNGESKKVGDKIRITGTMTLVAQWKNKDGVEDPINPNEKPEEGGRVQPWPGYWWYFGNNTDPIQATEVKTQEKQEEEMEKGIHHRYMYGYPDGTVRPEGTMTRAEAAALIARLAKLDMSNKSKPNFNDTEEAAWYNSAINAMVSKDLMFADKDGNFRPNQAITRAEFARALYGVDKKNDKVAPFADVKGHEFEAAINQAYGNGRINGYPDGTFRPDAYIQRAEAAKILNQFAGRGVDMEGTNPVRKDLIHFTDINESHWAYYEIMEAANTHEYQRAKGRVVETWLQILDK